IEWCELDEALDVKREVVADRRSPGAAVEPGTLTECVAVGVPCVVPRGLVLACELLITAVVGSPRRHYVDDDLDVIRQPHVLVEPDESILLVPCHVVTPVVARLRVRG